MTMQIVQTQKEVTFVSVTLGMKETANYVKVRTRQKYKTNRKKKRKRNSLKYIKATSDKDNPCCSQVRNTPLVARVLI